MIASTLRQLKKTWLFILVIMGAISCIGTQPSIETALLEAPVPSVTVENLRTLIDSDSTALVLDVRTSEEYDGPLGHIEGALLIPVQELEERMLELSEYQHQEIYVVCRLGGRSSRATRTLLEAGHNATNVEGGMEAWNEMNEKVMEQED
jgi:rhodanese-related sulfurtransferase